MDPQIQGSFIPKASLAASPRGASMGLLMIIALFIFVVSHLAAGAVFGYGRYLKIDIEGKDADLKKAEGAFESATIRDLVRLEARLTEGRGLLRAHVAPSAIFGLLERETLERVQFTSFEYALNPDGSASLSLEGRAASFSVLALQSDQLSASKVMRDVIFSGIAVSEQGGVNFAVKSAVDPSLLRYGSKQQTNNQQQTTGDQQPRQQTQPQPQTATSSNQTP